MKHYYVYILSSRNRNLYIGFTNNLEKRLTEHRNGTATGSSFTKRYYVSRLVYYETHNDPNVAIAREKQLKAGTRRRKIELIEADNPEWKDLSDGWRIG